MMHRFTACGLDHVWLEGGVHRHATPYGAGFSCEDVPGLHRAIGTAIVRQAAPLTGAEFRFLREELELSQAALAGILGADAQAIARWEKSRSKLPATADRLMRAVYRERIEGAAGVLEITQWMRAPTRSKGRLVFRWRGRAWRWAA